MLIRKLFTASSAQFPSSVKASENIFSSRVYSTDPRATPRVKRVWCIIINLILNDKILLLVLQANSLPRRRVRQRKKSSSSGFEMRQTRKDWAACQLTATGKEQEIHWRWMRGDVVAPHRLEIRAFLINNNENDNQETLQSYRGKGSGPGDGI